MAKNENAEHFAALKTSYKEIGKLLKSPPRVTTLTDESLTNYRSALAATQTVLLEASKTRSLKKLNLHHLYKKIPDEKKDKKLEKVCKYLTAFRGLLNPSEKKKETYTRLKRSTRTLKALHNLLELTKATTIAGHGPFKKAEVNTQHLTCASDLGCDTEKLPSDLVNAIADLKKKENLNKLEHDVNTALTPLTKTKIQYQTSHLITHAYKTNLLEHINKMMNETANIEPEKDTEPTTSIDTNEQAPDDAPQKWSSQ